MKYNKKLVDGYIENLLLIAPVGIEIFMSMFGLEDDVFLLIAPVGIEITETEHIWLMVVTLLIAPVGIEI